MYLVVTLLVKREVYEDLEEDLYFMAKSGWEFEEKEKWIQLKFYLPLQLTRGEETLLDSLQQLSKKYGADLELSLLPKERWEEIWKYHFPPLKVGKHLLLIPPWEGALEERERIKIIINPGQAFGTGHHATTQLMLENLEALTEDFGAKEVRVLDLGCGSGILAIVSAFLFPKAYILAVDIDELALEATYENLKLNKVENRIKVVKEIPVEEKRLRFHLILANIGFRELQNLAPLFKELSLPQETHLLLSGFLKDEIENLLKRYLNLGFKRVKSQSLREWGFLHLRR